MVLKMLQHLPVSVLAILQMCTDQHGAVQSPLSVRTAPFLRQFVKLSFYQNLLDVQPAGGSH